MRRQILGLMVIAALGIGGGRAEAAGKEKDQPVAADYTLKVHVSAARYDSNPLGQILTVVVDGKHYEISGGTSSAKVYAHGNGLLSPGDYKGRLAMDVHKTPFESQQVFELLLPDGTRRGFTVILQAE